MGLLKDNLIVKIKTFGEGVASRCKIADGLYKGEREETLYVVADMREDGRRNFLKFTNHYHFGQWVKAHSYMNGFEVFKELRHIHFEWDNLYTLNIEALMKLLEELEKVKKKK